MSETTTRLERWEARLKKVFDEIDVELEQEGWCRKFLRHPNRPPAGTTSNREDEGLFDLGAAFTAGFGSQHGPGYVIQARIATLEEVPPEAQERLEEEVVRRLKQKLPAAFPGIPLQVERDGHVYKIHGDLSLGSL